MFPEATLAAVYRVSRGIPRLINTVCENALISAYAERSASISTDMIEEVAHDLRLNVVSPVPTSPATDGTQAIAKSLLQLIEVLERAAKRSEHVSSDAGGKAS